MEFIERDATWAAAQEATRNKVQILDLLNFDESAERQVKVSVIVPVCNVEQFLPQCLDSILAQDLDSFEIICVNDGSPDGSIEILRRYATADSRVKVIDKLNAGYGHTMNIGMDMASGEFVCIVESDDYIRPGMLSTLYSAAIAENLDFVKSDFYRFTTEALATRLFYNALTPKRELYNVVLNPLDDIALFKFTNTWTGLYRASFLRNFGIRHQETPGASYQDNGFWFQTTCAAQRFMYLETPFYMNRRDNPNSSVFNDGKLYAGNREFEYIEHFLEKHPDLKQKFVGRLVKKKLDTYLYNYTRVSPDLKTDYINACSKEFLRAFEKDEVDEELFSKSDLERLRMIAVDPAGFDRINHDSSLAGFNGSAREGSVVIAMITDEQYVVPAATAITSLIENRSKGTVYHISVVGIDLSDLSIKKLTGMQRAGVSIEILSLNPEAASDLGADSLTNFGVPSTALVKFLLPTLLLTHKKVLYIDDDVLVRKDLSELFNWDLKGHVAGVVADMPQVLYEKQAFGSRYGRSYFNSGVLLLDLDKMRREGMQERLIETKQTLPSSLQDQDVFNEVFRGDVVELPIVYNTLLVNLVRSEGRYRISDINRRFGTSYRSIEDIRKDSCVVHYCSKDKPWKYFDVPMADDWMSAFLRSPFGDLRIRRVSVDDRSVDVVCNGLFEVAEDPDSLNAVLAVWVNQLTFTEVRSLVRSVERFKPKGWSFRIEALHESLTEDHILRLQGFSTGGVVVEPISVRRLLARDSMCARGAKLPSGYFKLIVSEVLTDIETVLVLDGAQVVGSLETVFSDFSCGDDDVSIALIDGGRRRLLHSGAVLLNTRSVMASDLKRRFLNELSGANGPRKGPVRAAELSLKRLSVTALSDSSISLDAHNRVVAMEDLRADVLRVSQGGAIQSSTLSPSRASHEQFESPAQSEVLLKAERKAAFEAGKSYARSSMSYRIGRLFTFVPGKIKRLLRGLRSKR